jgi:hypothetical protein
MSAVLLEPVVVRSAVPALAGYQDYREYLRFDFYFACAYCTVSETELKGRGFQIDHYQPQDKNGGDEYGNLMWSCEVCNRQKSAVWRSDDEQASGYRYVRPDFDNPADHVELNGFELRERSVPGKFTIEVLDLNRKSLVILREARLKLKYTNSEIVGGLQQLRDRKLDSVRAEMRAKFIKAREGVLEQFENLKSCAEGELIVKVLNHSPFLDPDKEKRNRNRRRKAYLESIGSRTDLQIDSTI